MSYFLYESPNSKIVDQGCTPSMFVIELLEDKLSMNEKDTARLLGGNFFSFNCYFATEAMLLYLL